MTHSNPALFESFNARNLAPQEVAQTFVPPPQFGRLIGQHHTLVLGPRGSGKTTLLKMLQPEALDAWTAPVAEEVRPRINYRSVFIATDISWGRQVACLGANLLSSEHSALLATASFTTQILRRLVGVMHYLTQQHAGYGITPEVEAFIARELATTFKLETKCASLLAVKYALGRRLIDLHEIASRHFMGARDNNQRAGGISDSALHLSFLPCCASAIDVFNDKAGTPAERWALLFDELEIAPEPIRDYLLRSLRSVDERFLFKLSLVPFGKEVSGWTDALGAQPGHDYEVIPLWYSYKDDGTVFCRNLWDSMLAARGLKVLPPDHYLGKSVFETDASEWRGDFRTAYRKGSKMANRFQRLELKDPTFADFLRREGIETTKLESLSGDQRAQTVRKATSIVALRDALLKATDSATSLRTRKAKVLDVYTGADAVFAITEGNPRWFKGIVGPLLDMLDPNTGRIPQSRQAKQIEKGAQRFRALLRTVPAVKWTKDQPTRGILRLLDSIGEFFYERLVRDPFTLDPPGTFRVDSRVSDEIEESLGAALNAGAIVSMEAVEYPSASLRSKRFRLCYLLAAVYRTPLRVERNVALSDILGTPGRRKKMEAKEQRGAVERRDQPELFEDDNNETD